MSTTDESVTDESTEETTDDEQTEEVEQSEEAEQKPDPDAGAKKALQTERAARKQAERELKDLRAELALKDKPAEEQALEQARAEARQEATAKANERIVRAEVKAAATGKVKNPALALKLIDTSEIEVDDDGEVDSDAVTAAIDDLLEQYPELAADGGKFGGSADQGAKGKASKPAQMTQAEFDRIKSDPRAVKKAKDEGLLNHLLGIES